ncbi:uncharacterized protein LOC125525178 isoform X1 [Triticum urartu]|uniref:uncharacterized protein LOC125525178 isoform X1 n=1 Tax=Triticum urartu TaxID=4572 RepID=UPI0020436352|nr:uncharacterized protein LOC125525178 isoform X1 [Triticum urartu]
MAKENTGTDNFSELSAPPGFPIRAYANQNHTLCPESSSVRDHEVLQKVNEEALLGKEGARIWKQHFAPKPNSDNIIQDSQEHVVETSEDKCASESMSASSTSALHKNKKRKDNIPMVETETRRFQEVSPVRDLRKEREKARRWKVARAPRRRTRNGSKAIPESLRDLVPLSYLYVCNVSDVSAVLVPCEQLLEHFSYV